MRRRGVARVQICEQFLLARCPRNDIRGVFGATATARVAWGGRIAWWRRGKRINVREHYAKPRRVLVSVAPKLELHQADRGGSQERLHVVSCKKNAQSRGDVLVTHILSRALPSRAGEERPRSTRVRSRGTLQLTGVSRVDSELQQTRVNDAGECPARVVIGHDVP